jgi:hypothetical protein
MYVDNIFNLLNKFDKEEDQISASFGFLLKQEAVPQLLLALKILLLF